jgi:hypothetical protein
MKIKLLLLVLTAFLISNNAFSQIPNNGFENWNNAGSYLNPAGWWTPNEYATGAYYPVTRSTDHYPGDVGNYSMRLENNVALYPDIASSGLTWTGDVNGSDYPVFPVIGHPNSFCGYYKFIPQNNDTAEIHIILYNNGAEVGGAYFKSAAPATSWTSFNVPFSGYATADSARIMILSCYDQDAPVPHGNSILYVDNLSFDNLISGVAESALIYSISIFPNPAKKILNITFPVNTDKQINMQVFNVLGTQIYSEKIFNSAGTTTTFDVSAFPEGIYFVRIGNEKQKFPDKKLIIVREK